MEQILSFIAQVKFFGKPKDENERFKMLKNLSGKSHEVITGISIVAFSKKIDHTFNQTTLVTVKNISNQEIKHYSKNLMV